MDHTVEAFYDPLRDTNFINPMDSAEITPNLLNNLYQQEQLTRDEYLVLDFFGSTSLLKAGSVTMSFQGLKRLMSLHQAQLTKAISRLVDKELLEKGEKSLYSLTSQGKTVFQRLFERYRTLGDIFPQQLFSVISTGSVQGPHLTPEQYEDLSNGLVGKWFGKFRFTSKIEYEDSIELGWVSTDSKTSASLIVGPGNELRLAVSAQLESESQSDLQVLLNHLSQSVESVIDAPVVFTGHRIYKNRQRVSTEADDLIIAYAG